MDLTRKRILVAEDDRAAGEALCADLRAAGAIALGPAPTAFYAMQLLGRRGIDAAVLDTELHGAPVDELADELIRSGVRVVFTLEDGAKPLAARFSDLPQLPKPCRGSDLIAALGAAASPLVRGASGPATESAVALPASGLDAAARLSRAAGGVIRRSSTAPGRTAD